MKRTIIIITIAAIMSIFITGCISNIDKELANQTSTDISMTVLDNSITKKGLTLIINNPTKINYTFTEEYSLQLESQGEWKDITTSFELCFSPKEYSLENDSTEMEQNWQEIYGTLPTGNYKLIKKVKNETDNSVKNIEVEFSV